MFGRTCDVCNGTGKSYTCEYCGGPWPCRRVAPPPELNARGKPYVRAIAPCPGNQLHKRKRK